MALMTNGKAHPVVATVATLGGIVAMPFATAGIAVGGTLTTAVVSIPTLGLGAIPGALVTAGATVGTALTSPFTIGKKIYNSMVPEEDRMPKSFTEELVSDLTSAIDIF